MQARLIGYALATTIAMAAAAMAQQQYPPSGDYPPPNDYPPAGQNVQPGQAEQYPQPANTATQSGRFDKSGLPLRPQTPTLVARGGQPGQQPVRPIEPPFTLTPQQQAEVARVLVWWEQRNLKVKTFDARFKRWTYDTVFGPPDGAKFVDLGEIRYAAPDKGLFRVDATEKNRQPVPIEETRAEDWKCDGKAIIEYNHVKKLMTVHKLPPERQGKGIADGPLPFLFGSTADSLKQRYFIRIVTPRDVQDQIWLQAYPRWQQDAANFHHAELIITSKMEPYALNLIQPNGKDKLAYVFYDVVINDPLRMFRGNPFRANTPSGWKSLVEEPASAQVRRPLSDGRR